MNNLRIFSFFLFSIFFFNNSYPGDQIDCIDPKFQRLAGLVKGYHLGRKNGQFLDIFLAGCCVIGGIALGVLIAPINYSAKQESENKKITQILALHTFIQDLLYALKDVYEHRKKVENSLVHYYLANNDNLEYFLHEQGINDPKIIGDLNEIMDCIRSLVNVCVNFEYTLLHMRTMSEQKYKLLELINGLFGRLNKESKAINQSEVTLDNDLVTFLLT